MFARVATAGWFVGSENLTVMVSSTENPAITVPGSAAVIDVMDGPAFLSAPKLPVSLGEREVETADVSSSFLRLPDVFTVNVRLLMAGGVAPVVLTIVMIRTDLPRHEPV